MKKIIYLASFALTLGLLTTSCSKDDGPSTPTAQTPDISSFSPTSGPIGTVVTINGSNFSDTDSENTVKIGNTVATVVTATATRINITVPQAATTGKVSVTVNGKTDTGGTFTVTENAPETSISLDKTALELFTLDDETLVPTFTGAGSAKEIVWSSNDENVAMVDEQGNITAVGAGSAQITATLGSATASCSITVKPSVFAVGYEEVNGVSVAKIWKNGVATDLTDGASFGAATSVFVDGTDVYVCGVVDNGLPAAMVWKNGTLLHELTDGTKYGFAASVHVYDGDVYVIGNEELGDENISNATIWKNGVTYATLTDGLNKNERSVGEDIFVNETGIYSAGYEESELHENGTPKSWEDTILNDLTNETYHGRAYSAYAVGSDVYVAGYEEDDSGTLVAKYWKNGEVTSLSDSSKSAEAQSIFVIGEDVYVAGFYNSFEETLPQAIVWKNSVPTNLGVGSSASSVYVYGEDIYVGGGIIEGKTTYAIIWKNGIPMELELAEGGGEEESEIVSVFVR